MFNAYKLHQVNTSRESAQMSQHIARKSLAISTSLSSVR